MSRKTFTVLFGGQAGYGIMSAGNLVAKAGGRNGLWAFQVNEYPSLIKGGLNTCLVRLSDQPLQAYEEELDCLGALSQEALDQNYNKLRPGALVIYDKDVVKADMANIPAGARLYPVKLIGLLPGDAAKVMANSAMLGAFCAITGYPLAAIAAAMRSEFKKPAVQEQNIQLLETTFAAVGEEYGEERQKAFAFSLAPDKRKKMLINGNDAISMGAIKAGVKFAAGYPMTPGSSVLTYLADHAEKFGLVFKQAEDEIAAVNMLIGAGFAGARAIAATSGGGFSLMVEALGFAAQAEVPIVIVNAQRGGPSTGLPTRTAQADLSFVVHASQGEFPRIVMAPGDVEECFFETVRVFNLAEKYQMPGIILTDKYLADSALTHDYFDDVKVRVERGKLVDEEWLAGNQPYLRYRLTEDGVSPRAVPGQKGGRHIATSYTHGEDGFYSSGNREYAAREPEVTAAGLDKLFNKVPALLAEIPGIKLHGPAEAELTVISWGSTKGAILEAMTELAAAGHSVNFLQILYPSPFPADAVSEVLEGCNKTLLIECNKTAQMGALLRAHTGYTPDAVYLKYDSRPMVPSQIAARIKEVIG